MAWLWKLGIHVCTYANIIGKMMTNHCNGVHYFQPDPHKVMVIKVSRDPPKSSLNT